MQMHVAGVNRPERASFVCVSKQRVQSSGRYSGLTAGELWNFPLGATGTPVSAGLLADGKLGECWWGGVAKPGCSGGENPGENGEE